MFEVGDNVVHPVYGAGTITRIEKRLEGGRDVAYYVIPTEPGTTNLLVPADSARDLGLREVIAAAQVEGILDVLKSDPKPPPECKAQAGPLKKMDWSDPCFLAALIRDLRKRITKIRSAVRAIEQRVPERLRERRANLLAQLKDLNVESDSKRILEEVAFISEKVDIHEECVRLKSHCSMFLGALTSSTASGKKLDFIAQEMLRETDTLAAKARDMIISRRAIEIKGEIEKLKEQVRNVE